MITLSDFQVDLDLMIKVFGILGVIATVYFGFQGQIKAINNQWEQEFYKQKMAIYLRASEVAAKIAALKLHDPENPTLTDLLIEFKTLYLGPMTLVEKKDVESAMVLFKEALDGNQSAENIGNLALYLSHICRNEAGATKLDVKDVSKYGTNTQILGKMQQCFQD